MLWRVNQVMKKSFVANYCDKNMTAEYCITLALG